MTGAPARWIEQAREDLETARLLESHGRFAPAAFHAQQAAEKALKGVLLAQGRGLPRTHDCFFLAKEAGCPDGVAASAELVTPFYFQTRYPDAMERRVTREEAEAALEAAEEVLAWAAEAI